MSTKIEITPKGALYAVECWRCGGVLYAHEWAHGDFNERRDLMEKGKLACDECYIGTADKRTFQKRPRKHYAVRCETHNVDWLFGPNKRGLVRLLGEMCCMPTAPF